MRIDKAKVIAALRARLRDNLQALTAAQGAAQSGAMHEETRQEDPKDTRAIEGSYLARGLAERVETLQAAVSAVGAMVPRDFDADDTIAIGAVVALVSDSAGETLYFLSRFGGGEKLTVDGAEIVVINTTSPLGEALIEKEVGDEIDLELPSRQIEAEVAWIA